MCAHLISNNCPVSVRPAISEKLPRVANFADLVHIEIGNDELILVACADSEHLSTRITEIALAVEFADVPRRLGSDAVDRADKITVRNCMSRLLEFPKILA